MIPDKPLPYSDEFSSADEYAESLLNFAKSTDMFNKLAGGVHLLDFFTNDRSLFELSLPSDWQSYILSLEPMTFVDILLRDDIDSMPEDSKPPPSLAEYIRNVRRHTLRRAYNPPRKVPKLKVPVAVGMKPKKNHEVANFADYIDRLSSDVNDTYDKRITRLVDFGSGQNYLGRTLALPPYNKHVIAVEGKEHNIKTSRHLDTLVGLATRQKVQRNKKMWLQVRDDQTPEGDEAKERAQARAAKAGEFVPNPDADFRPVKELEQKYIREPGKGSVSYVVSRLENGDLTDVIAKIENEVVIQDDEVDGVASDGNGKDGENGEATETSRAGTNDGATPSPPTLGMKKDLQMMAISIHSCGNLSHYGIRSLIMNPDIHAVAIVGCCYNNLTEKLGPPTYKFPYVRPSLQAVNGRVFDESHRFDPQGFPISDRLSTFDGHGVRFNITARMMACQAPYNWAYEESHHFFTRNLFRATLQKMLMDRGVIKRIFHRKGEPKPEGRGENGNGNVNETGENDQDPSISPFDTSTDPVILGSLRRHHFSSFKDYVRGAVAKLSTQREWNKYEGIVKAKMGNISDEEIEEYEETYLNRGREVAAMWSLMAFSAQIVESLIVTDRWLFLKEHSDVVKDAWVETVFDYAESPRNLVVVGIKR